MFPDLNTLDNLEGYRQYFMDSGLWQPHVRKVCLRHNLIPCQQIRPGLAGTCPTFIVEDRWVVKYFGRLFDGQQAHETEYQVGRLLPPDLAIPVAKIIGNGILIEGDPIWSWPYLIFEFIPGISIGEVYNQVRFEDMCVLAHSLGKATRQMLGIPLEGTSLFHSARKSYIQFLEYQRKHCLENQLNWGALPEHLLSQLEDYLLPVNNLVGCRSSVGLIHADITRDHILGRLEAGKWVTLVLIDFGDARAGNLFYDLAALHLDLFRYDKRLLRVYLQAYGLDDDPQFTHKAMSAALLHQFNVFYNLYEILPHARQVRTLEELANLIWDINNVGETDLVSFT